MSNGRHLALCAGAILTLGASIGTVGVAHAADPLVEEVVVDKWTWAFTPRLWYANEYDQASDDNPFNTYNSSTVAYPFGGGTVSVTPGLGAPTYSLTVLFGRGEGDVKGNGVNNFAPPGFPPLVLPSTYNGERTVQRLDVEAIAAIPLNEGISAIVGGRFINFKRKDEGVYTEQFPPAGLAPLQFPFSNTLHQNYYLAELGLTMSRAITDDGSFYGFAAGTAMAGYADVSYFARSDGVNTFDFIFNQPIDDLSGAVIGVDANVGLGWRISDNINLTGRYRLFYLSAPQLDFDSAGTLIHGPELNLTFSF